MDSPLFSVVLCTHKNSSFLFPAIDSVLSQSDTDWELVIVVNGANAEQIATAIESQYSDPRIRIIRSPVPQLAASLNIALGYCRGEYVVRHDDDDLCLPERLAIVRRYLQGGYDVIGFNAIVIDENDQQQGVFFSKPSGPVTRHQLLRNHCFIHPATTLRLSTLVEAGGYSGGFNSEDYDLWLRLSRQPGVRLYYSSEVVLYYRVHSKQSKGSLLPYAEVAGYMLREFWIQPDLKTFYAVCLHSTKTLWKHLTKKIK